MFVLDRIVLVFHCIDLVLGLHILLESLSHLIHGFLKRLILIEELLLASFDGF